MGGTRIISSYGQALIWGLQHGLTKLDLRLMRSERRYFSSPVHANSLLFKCRLRLEWLRFKWFFIRFRIQRDLEAVLLELESSPAEEWNPSLISRPSFAFETHDFFSLELCVIPSPRGFDWSTPRGLFFSLRNYLVRTHNHKIGHAMIVLKKNGRAVAATGMTGETNLRVVWDLVARRKGLEVLFKTFRGRLEHHQFVLRDIEKHEAQGHIEKMQFVLSKEQFVRCLDHLEDWCERGRYQNYGLAYDALGFTGASCTSYALGYLKVAGLLTEEHEQNWVRVVDLPERYLSTFERPLGWIRLLCLFVTESRWRSASGERYRRLRFWDPDLICRWLRRRDDSPDPALRGSRLSSPIYTDRGLTLSR